jgi:glycerol-3-phosphate dehydrogenase (NAD+)
MALNVPRAWDSSYRVDSSPVIYAKFKNTKFAILGGGAFSLAMAKVLSYKNISCNLYVRNETVANHINEKHFHPKYLVDCPLPSQLWATADIKEALKGVNYVIHAVPMQQSRAFLLGIKDFLPSNVPVLSVTKGVEQGTFSLMSDIITETLGPSSFLFVAFIFSGFCFIMIMFHLTFYV